MKNIQFIDLQLQRTNLGSKIDKAITGVLEHGRFILGPEVKTLESRLAEFGGMDRCVSCASGSDALLLPLMAWDIKAGDAVFCPSFTFAATAEMVALTGATPVFVDVLPDTYNMDVDHLEKTIDEVNTAGEFQPRAVIAVDLFGQMADYPAIKALTDRHGLKLVSDAAQSFGSSWKGKQSSAYADVVATSFFPAKPLGCYGDGGAVLTNDNALAEAMVSIRVHGQGTNKYDNVRVGVNSRLDTIQAAILIEKLAIFPEEIEMRNKVATRYSEALTSVAKVPYVPKDLTSTWAQYTILFENRDKVQAALREDNVPTASYYPLPLHKQTAYRHYPVGGGALPVSDNLAGQVLSLPMHPYLDEATQDFIIDKVGKAVAATADS